MEKTVSQTFAFLDKRFRKNSGGEIEEVDATETVTKADESEVDDDIEKEVKKTGHTWACLWQGFSVSQERTFLRKPWWEPKKCSFEF